MPSLRNLNLMKAWDHSNTKLAAKIVQDWKVVFYIALSKVPFIDYVPLFIVDPVSSLINMVPHSFRWQILRCWRLSRLAPQMLRNFGKSQSQIVAPTFNWILLKTENLPTCHKIVDFHPLISRRKSSFELSLSLKSQYKSPKTLCLWKKHFSVQNCKSSQS